MQSTQKVIIVSLIWQHVSNSKGHPQAKKATCILSNFKIEFSVPKVKGKAIPVQTWTGPEGSRRFRLSDFKTIGTRNGKVVNLTHRPPLPPGNIPGTHFC